MSSFYEILFAPPTLDQVTGLTLTPGVNGRLDIELVQPTQRTHRMTRVELTYVDSDFTGQIVEITIPQYSTRGAFLGLASGDVWVRAYGADAWGNVSVVSDVVTATVVGSESDTMWVPLLDGADGFVWLDHDLIYVKVPTP